LWGRLNNLDNLIKYPTRMEPRQQEGAKVGKRLQEVPMELNRRRKIGGGSRAGPAWAVPDKYRDIRGGKTESIEGAGRKGGL